MAQVFVLYLAFGDIKLICFSDSKVRGQSSPAVSPSWHKIHEKNFGAENIWRSIFHNSAIGVLLYCRFACTGGYTTWMNQSMICHDTF